LLVNFDMSVFNKRKKMIKKKHRNSELRTQNSELPFIITNPKSAGGNTGEKWAGIASDFATHFGAFNVAFTEYKGHAIELAKRAALDERKFIIACGGDGTINEVANGIMQSGTDAELGILPSGTGGDFRRALSLPKDTATSAHALRLGKTERMDVGRITFQNDDDKEETRYFLGVASFGISTEIVERVKRESDESLLSSFAKNFGGKASFAASTLETILTTEKKSVRVSIDDEHERQLTVTNLCVANARYFGGGMKIAPDALLNDGLFDVVTIGDLSSLEILTNAYKLYRGTHLNIERVWFTRASRLEASPTKRSEKVGVEIDGELLGKLPAEFEIIPKALYVRIPS